MAREQMRLDEAILYVKGMIDNFDKDPNGYPFHTQACSMYVVLKALENFMKGEKHDDKD
jgi:hypothetical protein